MIARLWARQCANASCHHALKVGKLRHFFVKILVAVNVSPPHAHALRVQAGYVWHVHNLSNALAIYRNSAFATPAHLGQKCVICVLKWRRFSPFFGILIIGKIDPTVSIPWLFFASASAMWSWVKISPHSSKKGISSAISVSSW